MADKKTAEGKGKAAPKKKVTRKKAKPKPKTTKAKMGRPSVFDSEEKVEELKKLMGLWPSLVETASWFKVSDRTIDEVIRKKFDMTFREFRDTYMASTRLNLKRQAIKRALGGSDKLMIELLRNWCGFSDKIEQTNKGDEVVEKANAVSGILKDPKLGKAALEIAEILAAQGGGK